MGKIKDLTGDRFGRLKILYFDGFYRTSGKNRATWRCECDCGNEKTIRSTDLMQEKVISCGCYRNEISAKRFRTHGLKKTKAYRIWEHMKKRCNNSNHPQYKDYGGRDITICDRWQNSFINFWNDMGGECPEDYSIDRIDNDGDYTPENCKWSTRKEQANNTRRNVVIEYNGMKHNLCEWSRIAGINRSTIDTRIKELGWPIEKALTTPVKGKQANA